MAGFNCIPMGLNAHPYYFTSPFSFLVESGAMLRTGATLVSSGLLVFVVSWFFGSPLDTLFVCSSPPSSNQSMKPAARFTE